MPEECPRPPTAAGKYKATTIRNARCRSIVVVGLTVDQT